MGAIAKRYECCYTAASHNFWNHVCMKFFCRKSPNTHDVGRETYVTDEMNFEFVICEEKKLQVSCLFVSPVNGVHFGGPFCVVWARIKLIGEITFHNGLFFFMYCKKGKHIHAHNKTRRCRVCPWLCEKMEHFFKRKGPGWVYTNIEM